MRGKILDFSIQTNTGLISGDDGQRYSFTGADWRENRPPSPGMKVDFDSNGRNALEIFLAAPAQSQNYEKNRITAGLLALFLGGFGAHKFYLGLTGPALVYLLTNTVGLVLTLWVFFLPNMVLGIFAFVEAILYLTCSDEEFQSRYVDERRAWF